MREAGDLGGGRARGEESGPAQRLGSAGPREAPQKRRRPRLAGPRRAAFSAFLILHRPSAAPKRQLVTSRPAQPLRSLSPDLALSGPVIHQVRPPPQLPPSAPGWAPAHSLRETLRTFPANLGCDEASESPPTSLPISPLSASARPDPSLPFALCVRLTLNPTFFILGLAPLVFLGCSSFLTLRAQLLFISPHCRQLSCSSLPL